MTTADSMSDRSLESWLAGLRADDARAGRRRQRWLEQQDAEQATLVGTLVLLSETGLDVVVETTAGRRFSGRLAGVGHDFCAVSASGRWQLLPIGSVAAVRGTSIAPVEVHDDRPAPLDSTLLEALAELLADRARVTITLASGEQVTGTLRNVGHDVVTLRTESRPPIPVYVSSAAIAEVLIG